MITIRHAFSPEDFQQVYRLNYETFVEEIPQHHPDSSGELIDKFHDENQYLLAFDQETLAGMIAYRDQRPFSLDQKINELDTMLPPFQKAIELRLLAVKKPYRNSRVTLLLLQKIAALLDDQAYDIALISGTVRQLSLYHKIGFTDFGPLVGTQEALYQPMFLTRKLVNKKLLS